MRCRALEQAGRWRSVDDNQSPIFDPEACLAGDEFRFLLDIGLGTGNKRAGGTLGRLIGRILHPLGSQIIHAGVHTKAKASKKQRSRKRKAKGYIPCLFQVNQIYSSGKNHG